MTGDGSQTSPHRRISTRHSYGNAIDDPFGPVYEESVSKTRQGIPALPLYGIPCDRGINAGVLQTLLKEGMPIGSTTCLLETLMLTLNKMCFYYNWLGRDEFILKKPLCYSL